MTFDTRHRYKPTAKIERIGRTLLARRTTRDAILGDENGVVDVPDKLGKHWARFAASADANNNATFGTVFEVMANPGAGYSPTAGRRVRIQLTSEGWEVVKGNFQDMVQAGIDPRALNPNDPYRAFRYLDEITDLSSRGIGSGLIVQVQGWKYHTADHQFKIDIGTNATTHLDLASSEPSAGNHRYAVVVFNVTEDLAGNDPWQVYDSTPLALNTKLTEANIQTAYDQFPADEIIVPIKAYYIAAGQTTIRGPRYDVDLRTAWNIPGVVNGQVTLSKLANGTPNRVIGFDGSGNPAEIDISGGTPGADTTAIHDDTSGEIAAIAAKTALVDDDLFIIEDSENSNAKKSTTLADISAAIGGGATGYIKISDQKASGTGGGTFTSGADRTRTLNTIETDTTGAVTLGSNQFVLPAGTYRAHIICPANTTANLHKAWLFDVGSSTKVLRSTNGIGTTPAIIEGRFTIASSTTFEVRHRCDGGGGSTFGFATSLDTEVYCTVTLIKE